MPRLNHNRAICEGDLYGRSHAAPMSRTAIMVRMKSFDKRKLEWLAANAGSALWRECATNTLYPPSMSRLTNSREYRAKTSSLPPAVGSAAHATERQAVASRLSKLERAQLKKIAQNGTKMERQEASRLLATG